MKKKADNSREVDRRKSGGSFAGGLMLGTMVGVVTTFLYGTKKGAKIRKMVEMETRNVSKKGKLIGNQAAEAVREKVDVAEKLLERARMDVNLAVKEGATKANEVQKSPKLAKIKKMFMKSGKRLKLGGK